jgi:hypothetical protein
MTGSSIGWPQIPSGSHSSNGSGGTGLSSWLAASMIVTGAEKPASDGLWSRSCQGGEGDVLGVIH